MFPNPNRTDVFICYSHEDRVFHDALVEQLKPELSSRGIGLWSDKEISPGTPWYPEIDKALGRAKVALLLVSVKFLNSPFIQKEELPRILSAQKEGLTVLWVKIAHTLFRHPKVYALQAAWMDPPLEGLPAKKRSWPMVNIGMKVVDALDAPPLPPSAELTEVAALKIEVQTRGDSESHGGDELLKSAIEARFVAMTFNTLRLALVEGHIKLPNLKVLELGVYALPALKEWHPLRMIKDIESEWVTGLVGVLEGITAPGCAPSLKTIDLKLINRAPGFTASQLTGEHNHQSIVRIRHTQVQDQREPVDAGTLVLAQTISDGKRSDPVFDYFAKAFDNIDRSMLFPVMRLGPPSYLREDLKGFVESLRTVTNLKQYDLPDKHFRVTVMVDPKTIRDAKISLKEPGSHIDPQEVYSIFDYLRSVGRADEFRLETADFDRREILLRIGDPPPGCVQLTVTQEHIVGVFGLLEDGNGRMFIKDKPKPAWSHDVPGGRVWVEDTSGKTTLRRELFEELGLPLKDAHIGNLASVKYDPKGALAGKPVIALYLRYHLDHDEVAYLEEVLPNATDGFPVVAYDITTLIKEKQDRRNERSDSRFPFPGDVTTPNGKIFLKDCAEAVCHAPLEGIAKLLPNRAIGNG